MTGGFLGVFTQIWNWVPSLIKRWSCSKEITHKPVTAAVGRVGGFRTLFNMGFIEMFVSLVLLMPVDDVTQAVPPEILSVIWALNPCLAFFISEEISDLALHYHYRLQEIISKASHRKYQNLRVTCICTWFHISCTFLIFSGGGDYLLAAILLNSSISIMATSLFKLVAISRDSTSMARWVIAQSVAVTIVLGFQGYFVLDSQSYYGAYAVLAFFPAVPAYLAMDFKDDTAGSTGR